MKQNTIAVLFLAAASLSLSACAGAEKRERIAGKPKVDPSRLVATPKAKAVASGKADDQLICRKYKKIGSNRLYTRCETVSDVKEAARNARSNVTGSPLTNTSSDAVREPNR